MTRQIPRVIFRKIFGFEIKLQYLCKNLYRRAHTVLGHRHKREPYDIHRMLMTSSLLANVLFLLVPAGYAVMVMSIGIGSNADAVEIYVRNVSSIVAIIIAGLFFDNFRKAHQTTHTENMKYLKHVTVWMGVAAIIKVLISMYYLVYCIKGGNIVLLFYVGEILLWSALALFAFCYYKRLND